MTRGRVFRECRHPGARDVMPWTWECQADWRTCALGVGYTGRSGIATTQASALMGMYEHLEAHRREAS